MGTCGRAARPAAAQLGPCPARLLPTATGCRVLTEPPTRRAIARSGLAARSRWAALPTYLGPGPPATTAPPPAGHDRRGGCGRCRRARRRGCRDCRAPGLTPQEPITERLRDNPFGYRRLGTGNSRPASNVHPANNLHPANDVRPLNDRTQLDHDGNRDLSQLRRHRPDRVQRGRLGDAPR